MNISTSYFAYTMCPLTMNTSSPNLLYTLGLAASPRISAAPTQSRKKENSPHQLQILKNRFHFNELALRLLHSVVVSREMIGEECNKCRSNKVRLVRMTGARVLTRTAQPRNEFYARNECTATTFQRALRTLCKRLIEHTEFLNV
jgi:hypothetical protein